MSSATVVDKVPVSLGRTPVSTESWHNVTMQVNKSNLSKARRSHSKARLSHGMDLLEGRQNVYHQGIVRLNVLYSCNFAQLAFNKNGPAMIVGQTEIFYIAE